MHPNTPLWKLRRLAPRALRVQARHRDKEPGLAAFDHTMALQAQALIDNYDGVRKSDSSRYLEHVEGKSTINTLLMKLRVWASHVSDQIDGVDPTNFGDTPAVPDDVISDAKALIERVEEHAAKAAEPLPFMPSLIEDLGTALEAARADWGQAEDLSSDVAAMRKATREAGALFERYLISYRRALAVIVGRGHPDYQKLRVEKARTTDDDDDPNAPTSGTPIEEAAEADDPDDPETHDESLAS